MSGGASLASHNLPLKHVVLLKSLQYPNSDLVYLSIFKHFSPNLSSAMKLSAFAIVGGFAAFALAAPAPASYVVHEKRTVQTEKWTHRRDIKLNRDALIPMSFGLAQSNLENGYDFLMDVSHPESKNYGKHWTMEKVLRNHLCPRKSKLINSDRRYVCSIYRDTYLREVLAYGEWYRK